MTPSYVTDGLEPRAVLRWFEDICAIPHGSGKEQALAERIAAAAQKHGYQTIQDAAGNLLVRIPGSQGYESLPPFLLQGHMDMVCAQADGMHRDMDTQPVELVREGDRLFARGTSLGADNAVGLSNMLAVMEDHTLLHPPLELLFTTREEIGFQGIRAFNASQLRARRMLTMDCGDPDLLITGSAGMATYALEKPYKTAPASGECFRLSIRGLRGGHSGLEIGCGQANALELGSQFLSAFAPLGSQLIALHMPNVSGIPNRFESLLAIPQSHLQTAHKEFHRLRQAFLDEYAQTDPELELHLAAEDIQHGGALSAQDTQELANCLLLCPCGPLRRETSQLRQARCSALFLSVELENGRFRGQYSIRANSDFLKEQTANRLQSICQICKMPLEKTMDYPAWPARPASDLRAMCRQVYRDCFGSELRCEQVHGGIEASVIIRTIPDMDIVGIAPFSRGAHTPKEYLLLSSMKPFWTFLTALLRRMCTPPTISDRTGNAG